jgi:hypothetical protein
VAKETTTKQINPPGVGLIDHELLPSAYTTPNQQNQTGGNKADQPSRCGLD